MVKTQRTDNASFKSRQAEPSSDAAAVPVYPHAEADQRSPYQTPKKNKSSDRWRPPPSHANNAAEESLVRVPTPVAINPFLSPVKGTLQSSTQSSLKKAKAYPAPVSDPAHSNPFEDDVIGRKDQGTPRKPGNAGGTSAKSPVQQGFLFAPSPKRLKSLLEVNSLHASSPRENLTALASPGNSFAVPSVTPRTRARKRLRGEEVDETPEKERERDGKSLKIGSRWAQARTSRLRRSGGGEDLAMQAVKAEGDGRDPQSLKRINVWKRNVHEETMTVDDAADDMAVSDDDDEALGPTPVKNPVGQLLNGISSGKRLFMDMLPPLDPTPRRPISVPSQVELERDASQHTDELDKQGNNDEIGTTNVARTPSKAKSRLLGVKPRTTESPQTTAVAPEPTVSDDKVHTSEDITDVQAFEGLPDDTSELDDTDDEEEAIPVEAVDLDEFEAGVDGPNAQPERTLSQKALAREVVLSDDEDREALDGEDTAMRDAEEDVAPKGGRTLRIESYRYTLQQKVAQQRTKRKTGIFDEQDTAEMQAYDDGGSEDESADVTAPNQPDPFQAHSITG